MANASRTVVNAASNGKLSPESEAYGWRAPSRTGAPEARALRYLPAMRPLNPRSDFRDDGGTPAWRANRATWDRTIEPPPRGIRARWRRLSLVDQVFLILGVLVAPMFFGICLLIVVTIWDAVFG